MSFCCRRFSGAVSLISWACMLLGCLLCGPCCCNWVLVVVGLFRWVLHPAGWLRDTAHYVLCVVVQVQTVQSSLYTPRFQKFISAEILLIVLVACWKISWKSMVRVQASGLSFPYLASIFSPLIFLFLEREEGRKKGRETYWLPLTHAPTGDQPTTQVCVLIRNWSSNLLLCRTMLNQLSRASQGPWLFFYHMKSMSLTCIQRKIVL